MVGITHTSKTTLKHEKMTLIQKFHKEVSREPGRFLENFGKTWVGNESGENIKHFLPQNDGRTTTTFGPARNDKTFPRGKEYETIKKKNLQTRKFDKQEDTQNYLDTSLSTSLHVGHLAISFKP